MNTPRRLPLLLTLSLFAQGAQVASTLLVARLALNGLALKDTAFWYLLAGMIPFIIVFDFGVGQTAAREVAFVRTRKHSEDKLEDIARTVLMLLATSTGAVGTLGAIGVAGGWAVGWIEPDRIVCIATFGIGTLIKVLANGTQGLLIGLERISTERLIRAGGSLIFCAGAWLFMVNGSGVIGLSLAWLMQALFCLIASSAAITQKGISVTRGNFRWNIVLKMREALIQYFLSALPGLFIFNLALYLVASVLDAKAIIVLSLTMQILSGMTLLAALPPGTLTASWSGLWARTQIAHLRHSVRLGIILVSLALSAFVAVVGMHTDLVSYVLFGKAALTAGTFITVYLAIGLIEGRVNCLTAASLSTGFVRFAGITWASAILVSLLTWPLTQAFGLLGVPLAVLIAQSATCWQRNVRVALQRLELNANEIRSYVLITVIPLAVQITVQAVLGHLIESVNWTTTVRFLTYCSASIFVAGAMLAAWRRNSIKAQAIPDTFE